MDDKKFYEEKAAEVGEERYYEIKEPLLKSLKDKRIEMVKKAMSDFVSRKIVADIGCGEGYVTLSYARKVKKVVCSDISETALAKAKKNFIKHGIKNFEIAPANGAKTGLKGNYFDAILCCSALDHVPDPIIVIKEISRILKKNGFAIFELDSGILPLFTGVRRNKKMLDKLGHYNRITQPKLKKMIRIAEAPLVQEKVYSWGSPFRFYYRLVRYFPFMKGLLDFLGRKFPSICYEYIAVYRKR